MCRRVVLDGASLRTLRDLDTVARLHVAVARAGSRLVVVNAGAELRRLVALTGLQDVLDLRCPGCADGSPGQTLGEAEQWEEAGVDEVRDADDAPL